MLKYHILDWFFIVFHTALIIFNVAGWIWNRCRSWNLITLLLTAFSWFVLGIFYGTGYCFLTHWHWNVLSELSVHPPEHSYIQYLLRRLLSLKVSADFAEYLTLIVFAMALIISLWLNVRDYMKRKSVRKQLK